MNGAVVLSGEDYLFNESESNSVYQLDQWSIDLLNDYLKKQSDQNPEKRFDVKAGIYRTSTESNIAFIHFSQIIHHSVEEFSNDRLERLMLRIDENPARLYLNKILQQKIKEKNLKISIEQINPQTNLYSIFDSNSIDSIQWKVQKEILVPPVNDTTLSLEKWEAAITNRLRQSNKRLQLIDYSSANELRNLEKTASLNFWKSLSPTPSDSSVLLQRTVNLIDQLSDSILFQTVLSQSPNPQAFLLDGYWIFDHFPNDSTRYSAGSSAILKLDIYNNTISGLNACNSIHSKFELNSENIRFTTLASTQKFCVENDVVESALLKTLKLTNKFKVDDCYLELMKNDSLLLVFRKPIQVQNYD